MEMSPLSSTSASNNDAHPAVPNPRKTLDMRKGMGEGLKGTSGKSAIDDAKSEMKRRLKSSFIPSKKRTKQVAKVPVRQNGKKTILNKNDHNSSSSNKHERTKDEKNFLDFVDAIRASGNNSAKNKNDKKKEAVKRNQEHEGKVEEKVENLKSRSLPDGDRISSLTAEVDNNLAKQAQGLQELQELQLLQELRQKAYSETASQEVAARLFQGGMGGLMAHEQNQSLATELREAQLRQESLQRLLSQQQTAAAATSLGGHELLQGGFGLDNLSALQLLQQQREAAEYAQLLRANSSLAALSNPGGLSSLASDVDPALLLRAKLGQSSVADPELLLRMNALNGASSAEVASLASGMGHLTGADSRLSQLQALSALNSGLVGDGTVASREALDSMLGLNQTSLLRASESSPGLSLASLMPGLDAGSSLGGASGLTPELRAALLRRGGSLGALQHRI